MIQFSPTWQFLPKIDLMIYDPAATWVLCPMAEQFEMVEVWWQIAF
jgi:hypothetical protein